MIIPWGYALNLDFGRGKTDPGPPLSAGYTSLNYTTSSCPDPGYYTVESKFNCTNFSSFNFDAGHYYYHGVRQPKDSGYMMVADFHASLSPMLLFYDTLHNLCSSHAYLFWAAIINTNTSSCFNPNLTFSVETTSGTVIKSGETGIIGTAGDKGTAFPGWYDPLGYPPPPFYGVNFSLSAGITDVVVKIIVNPADVYKDCRSVLLLDNILVSRLSPDLNVFNVNNPEAVNTSACFEGNIPVVLTSTTGDHYYSLDPPPVYDSYANLSVQWQESLDDGYTWIDIPGETGPNLNRIFSIPDTFLIRLRGAEAGEINDLACNNVSNVIRVEVDGLPGNYKLTSNSPVCTDGDLIFDLEGGATYTMTGPNGYFDNSARAHISHPQLADSGWYYATISTLGGCKVTDSTNAKIIGPNVHAGTDQIICYGQTVALFADGGITYSWTPATGLSSPSIPDPMASPVATTKYIVKVTDASGCSDTALVRITLRDSILKAKFTAPDVACPKDIVEFKDTSQGVIVAWNWDFGNGRSSTKKEPPTQTYPPDFSPRNYEVSLIITDTAGCSDTARHELLSAPNCYIDVPTAFSPNGDGNNDYLYPLNAYKATDLGFKVYNRMGQLVFETNDWTKKWDGALNGHPQPADIYVWYLEYIDAHGKKQTLKGTTLLVR
ncbi:MAG TPA: gliding motility-associated C-terminal domain-containing protein [Puia sp.]|jgi:gliding motility-associated-like protein